jgi:hypothetical protein
MATFYGKQTSKDKSIKKTHNKKTRKKNKNDKQPINSFQAIVPLTGQEKGVIFYGGISPSKIGLFAPY